MKLTLKQAEKRLDEISRRINTEHMSLNEIRRLEDELRRHITFLRRNQEDLQIRLSN